MAFEQKPIQAIHPLLFLPSVHLKLFCSSASSPGPCSLITCGFWQAIRKHRDSNLATAFQTATGQRLKPHLARPSSCTNRTQHLASGETLLQQPSPRSEFAACCSLHEHSTPACKAAQYLGELPPYLGRGLCMQASSKHCFAVLDLSCILQLWLSHPNQFLQLHTPQAETSALLPKPVLFND